MLSNQELPVNAKLFFDFLLKQSCLEVFELLFRGYNIDIKPLEIAKLEELEWKSVMLAISTSNYRVIALLHFRALHQLTGSFRELLGNNLESEKKYLDYVCEIGNNLCGSASRLLGAQGVSTGMSTPVIVENLHAAANTRLTQAHYETHVGGYHDGIPQLCASFFIFPGSEFKFDLSITSLDEGIKENTGELEFF